MPSAAFSSLHLPSLVKVPTGVFGRPARAAWAGWSRLAASAVAWGYGGRVAGGEIDGGYVSHALRVNHSIEFLSREDRKKCRMQNAECRMNVRPSAGNSGFGCGRPRRAFCALSRLLKVVWSCAPSVRGEQIKTRPLILQVRRGQIDGGAA